ncbi:MAG: NYN domain-containing protein [Nanoarchaeota archaeon]|nr:NYN domain-containing protein [Nanoarchaeota archaeon]
MISFLVKLSSEGKLQLVEPSSDIKDSYLGKSESNLSSSKILFENDKLEEAVALTYYSMYNLVLALLFAVGIKCENHSGVSILLGKVFGFDNSFLVLARRERIDKQYYTDFNVTKKEVQGGIVSAEDFNRELKSVLSGLNSEKIQERRNQFKILVGVGMNKEKIYKDSETDGSKIFPGDSSESPDAFSRVIVFIDNAYLLRLKKYFFDSGFSYSLRSFVEKLAVRNFFIVEKIFLYDAPPFQSSEPNKDERRMREDYDKHLFRFKSEGIIVREGRTQRLRVGESLVYRQKGVDMLLGIDMASVKNDFPKIKKVVLLTGDSDFVPVVDKLISFEIEVILWTYFNRDRKSPFSRSNYLIKSVSKYVKLTKEDFSGVGNE